MDYLGLRFEIPDDQLRGIRLALLSNFQFEGFEEDENGLTAYIGSDEFDQSAFEDYYQNLELFKGISYQLYEHPAKNWNSIWESGFDPVIVNSRLGIRASFHNSLQTEIELVIDPKMSFGTGHHATTEMMMKLMLDMNFSGKSVLDVGSGSGILSILASKLGADHVVAMDNDQNAVENCIENIQNNGASNVQAIQAAELKEVKKKFDVLLMNINKNTILRFADVIESTLKTSGELLVSGFLQEELMEVTTFFSKFGLQKGKVLTESNWIAASFILHKSD